MMETKEILEGNKLISNFLGQEFIKINYFKHLMSVEFELMDETDYNFCTSWDWLIPVVEKINNICDNKSRELSNNVRKQLTALHPFEDPHCWQSWSCYTITLTTNINEVYQQVIKFINWYNKYNNGN